jgi:hypothetical protein
MFEKCLRMVVTTPLAAEHSSFRYFAPGVGMIAEDEFELVKYPKSALAKNGKGVAPGTQPVVPIDQARAALDLVGADPVAESVWVEAINDPNLSDHDRQDLIEDLNENGFADPHNLTADDLPLVLNRLDLIDQLAPDAMDQVNSDAFDEAYKDLNNMLDKLTRP